MSESSARIFRHIIFDEPSVALARMAHYLTEQAGRITPLGVTVEMTTPDKWGVALYYRLKNEE